MARQPYERGSHRLRETPKESQERHQALKDNLVSLASRMEGEARATISELYPVRENTPLIHQANLERAVRNREKSMWHAQYKLRTLKDTPVV